MRVFILYMLHFLFSLQISKNLQVKELESQLMIERKLARQHVDSKIAEQHQMKHQEEQNNSILRSTPLTSRALATLKNFNDPAKPLMENILKPYSIPFSTIESSIKCIDHNEKENNPDLADNKSLLPKRASRASMCTMMTPRIPSVATSRRNSLIPLPSLTQFQTPFIPKLSNQEMNEESETTNCSQPLQGHSESPKEVKSGVKKIGSILRRSIHKKGQVRSPLQHHMRKVGGVNVGMEKVRVSIGSRGKLAQRGVQVGNGNRRGGGAKEIQHKNNHKDKERGWI